MKIVPIYSKWGAGWRFYNFEVVRRIEYFGDDYTRIYYSRDHDYEDISMPVAKVLEAALTPITTPEELTAFLLAHPEAVEA